MMLCAKKRRVRYCFECKDFPCESLEAFSSDGVSHHKRTVENMKKMKEIGIVAWIEEQKRKGQCAFCPRMARDDTAKVSTLIHGVSWDSPKDSQYG